ncbi:MAG: dihydropteroate synthase [Spirochaetia bacterium]
MKMYLSGNRVLSSENKALIMGILNATPDSFYSPSRHIDLNEAIRTADIMIREGADIIDIGGESTRPGSKPVEEPEEIQRIVPVIREIRKRWDIPISVDTRKMKTARAALDEGGDIINDISALRDDPGLPVLAAERKVPVILMHIRGNPETMQNNPGFRDTIGEIRTELEERIKYALDSGIEKKRIIIDPGIGFGKRVIDNLRIIGKPYLFKELGYPVLIGLSRKSFIKSVVHRKAPEDRLAGSLAANMFAAMNGADILRVHDVAETADCIKMITAIKKAVQEE